MARADSQFCDFSQDDMSYPTSTVNKRSKDEHIPLQKGQTHAGITILSSSSLTISQAIEIEEKYEDEYVETQERKCNRVWLFGALLFTVLLMIGVISAVLVLYFRNDRMSRPLLVHS